MFLMSTQAALFGPAKYGILPELLPHSLLSWGNGVLELGTFLALILGSVAGAMLSDWFHGSQGWSGVVFFVLSCIGLLFSWGVSKVPAAYPAKPFRANFLGDFFSQIRLIRGDRVLWLAVLGSTYFWFIASLLQFNIVFYGNDTLKTSATNNGILQAAVTIGIGFGSLAAGHLSSNKIEYGLIPLGSLGMTVCCVFLSFKDSSYFGTLTLLPALGFAAGFFVVPVNALIQHRPRERDKGSVIAAANLLSFGGISASSGIYYVLTAHAHFDPTGIFLVVSLVTVAATVYVLYLLPDALLRLLLWLITHTLYRIHVVGRENIPAEGGVLFVPNHVSMADAVLLIAATDRPIRFLMFKDYYENRILNPFLRILRVIPISSQQRPRELIHSLRVSSQALKDGEVVCIFPEGEMTRIGQILPFRRGMERIMKDVDAPVIPINIDGIWGSIFSFKGGRFLWKVPRRIPYPVTIAFGKPLPATTTSLEARQVVQELGAEVYHYRKRYMRPLHRTFVGSCRRHPLRFAMADGRVPRLRFGNLLIKTLFLARRLRAVWDNQRTVGIFLPPTVAGAIVNWAALMMGKVPVNLNYTASNSVLESCAKQSELQTVVTSRVFLDRIQLQPPARVIFIEDLTDSPRVDERLIAVFLSLLPVRLVEKTLGVQRRVELDDVATIIFTSGSTGDPKGVLLSHYNIGANVQQIDQIFMLKKDDRIMGILPFFHSFGFTGTLCLPAALGLGVVFHPNPLEARAVGGLISKYAVTFLLATPTFLQVYLRRCPPEEFGSLRHVMAGAEKLPERLAIAFEDHFGIRPQEGYGCTECSPAVSINTHDFRAAAFRQVGAKRGTIGHPLPGVAVRIVDPDTLQPLLPGQEGLLLVRGPNVMQSYLNRPEKTAEVLHGAWYNTGDVASVDEAGFIRIVDRLSRFSKIGGEMIPHIKIEDKLHELAGVSELVFAVTGVPDEKKGEHLVVLHTLPEDKLQACLTEMLKSDLPALWKPRPDQFVFVNALPLLGSGKLDQRRIREIAIQSTKIGARNDIA